MNLSDLKAVSPLTDGFAIGEPIHSHFGVSCYPAIHTVSKEKFILKRISIPESQSQIDALLLTGACADEAAVREYYKNVVEELRHEIELQQQISSLPGFAPIYGYQIEPKEDAPGYDVYLLSSYRTTLAAFAKKNALTHLSGVNLGIDLASALAACHHAGYLYQDLKPENIFITPDRQFQIGDLGFVPLAGLNYATFPDKYLSPTTAPEVQDFMASMNPTIDIYALGMVLYWIYNGCKYPFEDECDPAEAKRRRLAGEALPAPVYADYELASIILKACAFKPEERWLAPAEMSHALISYMQRNSVNDSLIGPPVLADPAPLEAPSETLPSDEGAEPEASPETADTPAEAEGEASGEPAAGEDESAPGEADVDEDTAARDEDTAGILEKANELLAQEGGSEEAPAEAPAEDEAPAEVGEAAEAPLVEEAHEETEKEHRAKEKAARKADRLARKAAEKANGKKHSRAWLTAIILLVVAALLGGGGFAAYRLYYCVPVSDLAVTATDSDTIAVSFQCKADPQTLLLTCKDTYGNTQLAIPTDGAASFTGLLPGTQYNISLSITGFHKLTGSTLVSYTTEAVAKAESFTAVTGSEDGSAIVSFTVSGPESESWIVQYEAEGEAQRQVVLSGHSGTISGLTLGKTYTLRLCDKNGNLLMGSSTLSFTAGKVLLAQDITFADCTGTALTVTWSQPETPVAHWTVRCFDTASGYSETQEVSQCSATFTGLSADNGYTVEITAEGMTKVASASITNDPITLSGAPSCTPNDQGGLDISWEFTGKAPSGWVLTYTADYAPDDPVSVNTDTPACTLDAVIPGTHYDFTIHPADGRTFLGAPFSYDAPAAGDFTDYNTSPASMSLFLIEPPEGSGWESRWINVSDIAEFTAGTPLCFVLMAPNNYWAGDSTYQALYVLRDGDGKVLQTATETVNWGSMWQQRHYVLDLEPPANAGRYSLEIYFNGLFVKSYDYTLVSEV